MTSAFSRHATTKSLRMARKAPEKQLQLCRQSCPGTKSYAPSPELTNGRKSKKNRRRVQRQKTDADCLQSRSGIRVQNAAKRRGAKSNGRRRRRASGGG
eukprot:6212998-Pleurochrysis_carterae.AAC.2